jgi:MSHA biogenesis protein MshL
VTELLRLLLRETAVSLVPDPGIDETFTGELKDVTLRQALNLVLAPHDLDYRVDDQVLRVFRRPLHTRVFELNFVAARRVTTRRVSTGHAAGVASRTELVSTDTRDVFAELEQAVEPLLSSTGRAHLDRGAALLRVTDLPERLDAVSAYLDRVVRRLGRQVRLEALIVEVVLDDPASAGLDWAELGRLAPTLRGIGGTSIRPVLPDRSEVERFLRALARQGVVTTISRSTAVTMNNEPVMIRTDSRRLPTGRLGEVATSPTTAGVVLSMTPQVGRDGVVTVSATPSVTTTVGSTSGDAVSTLTVRETDTLVRVRDGHTAVLSGWVHRGEPRALGGATPTAGEGVPVPAASAIELLILLTPTVIDGA